MGLERCKDTNAHDEILQIVALPTSIDEARIIVVSTSIGSVGRSVHDRTRAYQSKIPLWSRTHFFHPYHT